MARAVKTLTGRDKYKKMLLEGELIVDWALDNQISVNFILIVEGTDPAPIAKYTSQGIEVFQISAGIQKKVTGRNYLIPIVGVGNYPVDKTPENKNFVLVLDNVKDFGNIGTIIRTCSAFGITHVLSTSKNIDLFHKKTIEASRGCVFSTKLDRFQTSKEVVRFLRDRGYQIIATSPKGNRVQSFVELEKKPVALVVGNERTGVSLEIKNQADVLIQIPTSSDIESLNVGVAAGISIYELTLKQVMSMIEDKIKATLGRELNVAGMLVQEALDFELKKITDLNSQQVIFMMVLKCDREMSLENMCRQFGILPSEVNPFLKPLIEKGFTIQHENLHMTDKGEEVLSKLWFTIENTEKQILSGFSKSEVESFKNNLYLVQQNCIKMIEKGNEGY
ncbi:MAG: TrmH family RNA methyltransferase [Anaerolineales bacterium]